MTEQNEQKETQSGFSFAKMIADAKGALLDPKGHFSSMAVTGGLGEPIIKALIYGTVAGVFSFIWSVAGLTAIGGGGLGFLTGNVVGIAALFGSIVGALIALFIGGVILLIISAICSGTTDFEANLRVTSDLMVLLPIKAALGFLVFLPALHTLTMLVANLYGLWMLFHALKGVLQAKAETAKVITLVLAALLVIFSLIGMATHRAVKHLANRQEKILEQYTKAAEEIAREAGGEEAAKVVREATEEAGNGTIIVVLEKVDGTTIKGPDGEEVNKALEEMKNDNDVVILSRGDNDFIQAMRSGDGYILQYKDDQGLHQYAGSDGLASESVVIRCFSSYNANPTAWKMTRSQFEWKDAED